MADSQPADPAPNPPLAPSSDDLASQPSPEARKSPESSSGSIARYVLYVLFGLTLLGLGYDQLARREARYACEVVETAIENQSLDNRLKSEAVRELLARQPDATVSDESSDREIYRWRGTLLSYDVTVEYTKEGELKDVRLGGQ